MASTGLQPTTAVIFRAAGSKPCPVYVFAKGGRKWIVASGNLLVRDGRLAAVIDFGSSGIGDPACDVVIAWTFLSGASRDRFRAELDVDAATWSRGRGWALWKALITRAHGDIAEVLADYERWR